MRDFYAAIWRRTWHQQIILIVLSLLIAGLAAVPIEYQKQIINYMTAGAEFSDLLSLGVYMALVISLSQFLKATLRYKSAILGERVTEMLRSSRLERRVSFLKSGQQDAERGTLANIISSESEAVGAFVGSAIANPLLQIGTLVSVISYIAVTQPTLGIIILIITAPQALLVILVQPRINALVRERVVKLRGSINSITTSELAAIKDTLLDDFDRIFHVRRKIFLWKISSKFLIGLANGAGLIIVLVYGGWLVTEGRADVGGVVAATVALGRVQEPWKELIAFFRSVSIVVVQYQLLRDVFTDMSVE